MLSLEKVPLALVLKWPEHESVARAVEVLHEILLELLVGHLVPIFAVFLLWPTDSDGRILINHHLTKNPEDHII